MKDADADADRETVVVDVVSLTRRSLAKMKIVTRGLFAFLAPSALVLAAAAPAVADPSAGMSLKEKQAWEERTAVIEKKAAEATNACGTKITAAWDVASFKGQDVEKQSPTAACRDAIYAVTWACSTEVGKAAVQRSVSSITCRSSSSGTKPALEGKHLVVGIDSGSGTITLDGKPGSHSWSSAMNEIVHAPAPEPGQPDMPLRERKEWDEIIAHMKKNAAQVSTTCGTTINARVDVASFRGLDVSKKPPTAKCRDAIDTLGALCASSTGKKTVQSKVSDVVCKSSSDGTKPSLAGHTLTVHIDPDKGVGGSWKTALESTL